MRLKINKRLNTILTKWGFLYILINKLKTPSSARTQHSYTLAKMHKSTLKIRPIVATSGGIFDRLGWLLQQILKPLSRSGGTFCPPHKNPSISSKRLGVWSYCFVTFFYAFFIQKSSVPLISPRVLPWQPYNFFILENLNRRCFSSIST